MTTQKAQDKLNSITRLTTLVDNSSTIWANVVHVSKSGMMRHIKFYVAKADAAHNCDIINITRYIGAILDWKIDKKTAGLKVTGCGMDMAFHTLYSLGTLNGVHFAQLAQSYRMI